MKIKTLKKLQLLTALLFIVTILTLVIGLVLINFSTFNLFYFNKNWNDINGYTILKHFSLLPILEHSANYFYNLGNHHIKENYYNWTKLKFGIIFSVILFPIFTCISMSLTFFMIGLKVKIKNNNFWDAIANCEIISNYYVH